MESKRNTSLLIGLAIPVAMIVFVAASIYLPRLWAPLPQINFVYAIGDYYGQPWYSVSETGVLVKNTPTTSGEPKPAVPLAEVKLYLHDTVKNESRQITFAEGAKLRLDSRTASSDGFRLIAGNRGGSLPFGGGPDYGTYYLKGHSTSYKLNLEVGDPYYYNGVRFLGWVNP